jgi:hypothetical protein
MKRHIYTFLAFSITATLAGAQNLVPNPSFENYKNIPCGWNVEPTELTSFTNDWYSPATTSTDIHNTLADSSCWANPTGSHESRSCRIGYQQPRTGNVIAGIYTEVNTHTWHEYLQVKLKEPLHAGQRYCVEMYVSAADFTSNGSNNIGMLFTKDAVKGDNIILGAPQINSFKVITDKDGWTLISGSFIASEDDEFLTIGNFYPDNQTDLLHIDEDGCSNGAYYYIDDVAVYLCPV